MPVPLAELRNAAKDCTACPLWRHATATVFGEGPATARCMLVGEQPGDVEDRMGRPFVGPAGKLLDRALADAGLDRSALYLTNAVKHFKWEPRGKRRMHKTPAQAEVDACHRWLDGEVAALAPVLMICLGTTAAHAVLGGRAPLKALRGRIIARPVGAPVLVTIHPSAVLRAPSELRETAYRDLVADLATAAVFMESRVAPP